MKIINKYCKTTFLITIVCLGLYAKQVIAQENDDVWKFVSIPDFLNVDVEYPEPKWDDALDYTLANLKGENPDFVLVAGDMVMGRWWRSKEQVEYMADIYYTAWTERMKKFGLKYYVAVGDHEVGDNPWLPEGKKNNRGLTWDCAPIEFLPYYEEAFVKYFQMPENGPVNRKGLSYYVEHKNALIVTIDVFEQKLLEEHGEADVSEEQIQWLDSLLKAKKDYKFKIVQAHTPIIGPVRKKNSSGLMLKDGINSKLWQTMVKHDIDLYLCGEVHAITCIEKDNIEQISHGSLFGYNEEAHYLIATVHENKIELVLKEISLVLEGRYLQQSAMNEPREIVRIKQEDKEKGFRTVGTMILRKKGKKKEFTDKTGYFTEEGNPQPHKIP